MPAFRLMMVALSFCLPALTSSGAHAACSKVVSLGMIDWPPYIIWDGNIRPSGLDMELIDAVFQTAGCTYTVHQLPFKRALKHVETGHVDGAPLVSYLPERARFGHYTLPLRQEIIGAFVRAETPTADRPQEFDDLVTSDKKVGIVLGGWYGPRLERAMANNANFRARVQTHEDFEALFQALATGAVDVAINDVAGGRYIAERTISDGAVHLLPFAVNVNEVHLLLSRKTVSNSDIETLNAAIALFRRSPDYQLVLNRYLPAEFMKNFQARGQAG